MENAVTGSEKGRILVEFYDSECLENVVSLLCGNYSAVTYVYFRHANEPDQEDRKRLSEFVRRRFGFFPKFLEIPENTMDAALERFQSLADQGLCDVDITGGSSTFIAAAGALQMKLGRERVRIHEYDVAAGRRKFSCPEDRNQIGRWSGETLSVLEGLELRGIQVLESKEPTRYEMRGELRAEVLRLWETVRSELRAWNAFSTLPAEYTRTWSSLLVEKRVNSKQYSGINPLLDKLLQAGILSDLKKRDRGEEIHISFRLNVPESAYVLYQKGGNLLEMLTCLAIEDSGCFADCHVGLVLDWEDRGKRGTTGPYNELDVVATRGYIPCVISCKNTKVENEYLYEILTMTRHFGGEYAVPVMVSTVANKPAIRERAAEMGVVLIDEVGKMTVQEFEKMLCAALCGSR